MGIGFVFIVYLIGLAVVTVPAMFICAGIAYLMARQAGNKTRRKFVIAGGLVPIVGAIYVVVCLAIMAVVGVVTGKDVALGDGFDLPLHNHYHWSVIATNDASTLFDAGNHEVFLNVLELQEHDDWLAGSYESRGSSPQETQGSDRWFLFNTRTQERIDCGSENELRDAAEKKGFVLNLESSGQFYSSHRYDWIDRAVFIFLAIPPVVALVTLVMRGRKILILRERASPY